MKECKKSNILCKCNKKVKDNSKIEWKIIITF